MELGKASPLTSPSMPRKLPIRELGSMPFHRCVCVCVQKYGNFETLKPFFCSVHLDASTQCTSSDDQRNGRTITVAKVFYGLGIGLSGIIAYGSHQPSSAGVVKNTWIVAMSNAAFSFCAGRCEGANCAKDAGERVCTGDHM